ncbi:hypothetical protein N8525_04875 [Verrucomicrobiales bacterium]|nr:hypothetical protein [Verrucomicrobiales bacterium]
MFDHDSTLTLLVADVVSRVMAGSVSNRFTSGLAAVGLAYQDTTAIA